MKHSISIPVLSWISLISSNISSLAGTILVNPFSAVRTAMVIVGITMVVEALGGFWNLPALKARPEAISAAENAKPVGQDEDINA